MKKEKWIVCLGAGAMTASLQPLLMMLLWLAERSGHPVLFQALEGPIGFAWWILALPAFPVFGRGALTFVYLVVFWFIAGGLIARSLYNAYERQQERPKVP